MLSHIVSINDSQKNYIDMLFGCDKSLLRQSYLLLMLPYVRKIKVPEKVKFQRNKFSIFQRNLPRKNFRILYISKILSESKRKLSVLLIYRIPFDFERPKDNRISKIRNLQIRKNLVYS